MDKTYKRFLNRFKECLEADENLTQVRVALDAKVSESYISQVLSGKKTAGFKAQVAIAKACGYDYIDFLSLSSGGNELHHLASSKDDSITENFKYPDKGILAIKCLSKIEKLSRKAFFSIVAEIENLSLELEEGINVGEADKADMSKKSNRTGTDGG